MPTVNYQVSASADDGKEVSGTVDTSDTDEVSSGHTDWFAFRFQSIAVPQGVTIDSATLQIYVHNSSYDDPRVDIHANDVDSATELQAGATSDISSRALTTAATDWDDDSIGTGWKSAPDIASVIQEIVNREGWSSGNDLMIIFDLQTDVRIGMRMYDYSGNAHGAKLSITYTAGQPAMHHYRQRRI